MLSCGRDLRARSTTPSKVGAGDHLALTFTPNGKALAWVSGAGVRLWDLARGREVAGFPAHGGWVTSLAFTPDGRTLCSTGHDGAVRLWDAPVGTEQALLRTPRGETGGLSLTPDGKVLASSGTNGTVHLWDMASRREIGRLRPKEPGDEPAFSWEVRDQIRSGGLAFSPDGRILTTGDTLWDWKAGKELNKLADGWGTSLSFAPDGKTLAGINPQGAIFVWVATTGKIRRQIRGGHRFWQAVTVSYLPDGTLAAIASDKVPHIERWNVAEKKKLPLLDGEDAKVWRLAVSPDGRRLAVSFETRIKIWDLTTHQKTQEFITEAALVTALGLQPRRQDTPRVQPMARYSSGT